MASIVANGIDVSRWQGGIDFSAVKSQVSFVIIKAGGSDDGFYTDRNFEQNYKGAKDAGLNVGCYYFVGPNFTSTADGEADAKRFLDIIKGKTFEYPVCLDLESTPVSEKAGATDAAIAFCKAVEAAGYFCTIYASDIGGFKDRMDVSKLDCFDKWVARYGSSPTYVTEYGMWQYTSEGSVKGISGNVDLDYAYKDYPSIIKGSGLNGFSAPSTPDKEEPTYKPVTDAVVDAVYRGDYGNGDARYNKLAAEGYDPQAVQDAVNAKYYSGGSSAPAKKSLEEIARLVYRGEYGNGEERRQRLKAEGYDPDEVQAKVNELYY